MDCAGVPGGTAVVDCQGDCEGTHAVIEWAGNGYAWGTADGVADEVTPVWVNAESYAPGFEGNPMALDATGVVGYTVDGENWSTKLLIPEEAGNNIH